MLNSSNNCLCFECFPADSLLVFCCDIVESSREVQAGCRESCNMKVSISRVVASRVRDSNGRCSFVRSFGVAPHGKLKLFERRLSFPRASLHLMIYSQFAGSVAAAHHVECISISVSSYADEGNFSPAFAQRKRRNFSDASRTPLENVEKCNYPKAQVLDELNCDAYY